MVCQLCGEKGAYHFHDNAPAYCPNCGHFLTLERINIPTERAKKLKKIMAKIRTKKDVKWYL